MSRTGDLATLRFFFAKKQVDECNGDFSTVEQRGLIGLRLVATQVAISCLAERRQAFTASSREMTTPTTNPTPTKPMIRNPSPGAPRPEGSGGSKRDAARKAMPIPRNGPKSIMQMTFKIFMRLARIVLCEWSG
jgi:hypothetical protein